VNSRSGLRLSGAQEVLQRNAEQIGEGREFVDGRARVTGQPVRDSARRNTETVCKGAGPESYGVHGGTKPHGEWANHVGTG
jgi:hypothetical protein